MPQGVKLLPGRYRFTTTDPHTVVEYDVTENEIRTNFGDLEWSPTPPEGGVYVNGTVGMMCFPDGTFKAMHGGSQIPGTWLRL